MGGKQCAHAYLLSTAMMLASLILLAFKLTLFLLFKRILGVYFSKHATKLTKLFSAVVGKWWRLVSSS